jgi:PAS domain S-box-containing protein
MPIETRAWWSEQVVDGTPDGIVVADREGVIRVWNAGAEALLGYQASDAIGQRLALIIPEAMQGAHWDCYDHAMATGKRRGRGVFTVLPVVHRDGTIVRMQSSLAMLRDPATGATSGAAVIMRAVSLEVH